MKLFEDEKEKFIPRDLSWLSFNERVLEEASDPNNPLLEQLRFLAIFVSNLDEFHMVRVAGLKNVLDSAINRKDPHGYYPLEVYDQIKERVKKDVKLLYDVYKEKLKELEKNEIVIKSTKDATKTQKASFNKHFESTLYPIVTPMAVDPGHPFPVLPSRTMALAVHLSRKTENFVAILPLPSNIPRVFKLTSVKNEESFILIDEIIKDNLDVFFKGYKILDAAFFRVIRDSELAIEEEVTPNLLKAIEEEVKKRSWGKVVYMEIEASASAQLKDILCERMEIPAEEVIPIDGAMDLSFLWELSSKIERPQLMFKGYAPATFNYENIFTRISEEDFITHLPYQSFHPTVDLVRAAAADENVLAIKMTLYRTNRNSAIVAALKDAAKNKKQVTVLVEIKARFDEESNIHWVRELEASGCHVIYGIPGLKVHSKMTLIVRKEEGIIRRYVHLSTGNYNENTGKIYTDIGYFTSNEDIAKDISDMFNVVTGYSMPSTWKRIVSSPNDLRKYFFYMIEREITNQKKNKTGKIWAKLNSLEDPQTIQRLYEASCAGVEINLIVRGICCLVPGVKDLSENIKVKSIVGRFLEHSRMYMFNNNNSPRVFLSSADWMTRNLDKRVELLFEVYNVKIKDHLRDIINDCWKDNVKTRWLQSDGTYKRASSKEKPFNVQEHLIQLYAPQ